MSNDLTANLRISYLSTTGPKELEQDQTERSLKEITSLQRSTDKIQFNKGDFIPDFPAFNGYLEATLRNKNSIVLTKDQAKNLIYNISRQLGAHGIDHLAMKCLGTECMKYHTCALAQSGVPTPDGESCPIEMSEIQEHLRGFASDFEDLPTYADKVMVHNVVACEVIKGRILSDLAQNPSVTVQVAKGVDRKGNTIYEASENPNQKSLQNINRTQERLLKSLHMTLEQKKREQDGAKKKTDADIMKIYADRLKEFVSSKGVKPILDADAKPLKEKPLSTIQEESDESKVHSGNESTPAVNVDREEADGSPRVLRNGAGKMARTETEIGRLNKRIEEKTDREPGGNDSGRDGPRGGKQVPRDPGPGIGSDDMEVVT